MIAGAVNFMALEAVLVKRLESVLAALEPRVKVYTIGALNGLTRGSLARPCVQLLYRGYRVNDTKKYGRVATIEQSWVVIVSTRNVSDMQSGASARSQAGEIASHVCNALMGFSDDEHMITPMVLTHQPMPVDYSDGFIDIPFAFTTQISISNPPT